MVETCKKIDDCSKIKMLMDHDWSCDTQLANSIADMCDKCEYMEGENG